MFGASSISMCFIGMCFSVELSFGDVISGYVEQMLMKSHQMKFQNKKHAS